METNYISYNSLFLLYVSGWNIGITRRKSRGLDDALTSLTN